MAPRADPGETAVIEALRRGDARAFARLVDRHHGPMVRVGQLYVGDRGVAEEVVQETWLAVLEGIDRFEARLVHLVTEYLEGTLSASDRRRFDDHLASCDGWTAYLEQVRQTISISGALTEDRLEPAARAELRRAFRRWHAGRR